MYLAGGDDGAQGGACEGATILGPWTVRGIWEQGEMNMGFHGLSGRVQSLVANKLRAMGWFGGLYFTARLQDLAGKTQDRTMQDRKQE